MCDTRLYLLDKEESAVDEDSPPAREPPDTDSQVHSVTLGVKNASLLRAHLSYGHLSLDGLRSLSKQGVIKVTDAELRAGYGECETCVLSKMKRSSHKSKEETKSHHEVATTKLGRVYSDLCGPMVPTVGGHRYFITFVDEATRYLVVYLVTAKSEVPEKLQQYESDLARPEGLHVRILRTDGEEVYLSAAMKSHCDSAGIRREVTARYTPEGNGIAERMNQTLVSMTRAMLTHSGLQKEWWGHALLYAAYIRNRCPTKALGGRTPFEAWHGHPPVDGRLVHPFGNPGWVYVPEALRGKLDQRAEKAIFIGASPDRACAMFYVLSSKTIVHTVEYQLAEDSSAGRHFDTLGGITPSQVQDERESDHPVLTKKKLKELARIDELEQQRVLLNAKEQKQQEVLAARNEKRTLQQAAKDDRAQRLTEAKTKAKVLPPALADPVPNELSLPTPTGPTSTTTVQPVLGGGESKGGEGRVEANDESSVAAEAPTAPETTTKVVSKAKGGRQRTKPPVDSSIPVPSQPQTVTTRSGRTTSSGGAHLYDKGNYIMMLEELSTSGEVMTEDKPSRIFDGELQAMLSEEECSRDSELKECEQKTMAEEGRLSMQGVHARDIKVPRGHVQASRSPQAKHWADAQARELAALAEMNVARLVDRPARGSKVQILRPVWSFKVKEARDGMIDKFKARLCADGSAQQDDNVYSPVARNVSVRCVLALAVQWGFDVHHLDVVTAYLYGELGPDDKIYLEIPAGAQGDRATQVWRLQKAIYGLKQSAKVWNTQIDAYLRSLNFSRSPLHLCEKGKKGGSVRNYCPLRRRLIIGVRKRKGNGRGKAGADNAISNGRSRPNRVVLGHGSRL